MTDRFRRKVRSQRGASLLLALLFLLICAMVGASILMAAASNAGKHRSNLTEHQTYLALSSAVSLLCDELNAAQYQGQYKYWTTTEIVGAGDEATTVTKTHFQQLEGIYTGKMRDILLADFDMIFAETCSTSGAVLGCTTSSVLTNAVTYSHRLALQPNTETDLDGRPVTIQLKVVEESYAMELTATLDGYSIQAELTPKTNAPALPASFTAGEHETNPMQWKLGWITTGAEEGDDP